MAASGDKYEVFLNFRGEDTRSTITDHVYQGLDKDDARIRVFRDNEGLHVGETIGPELLKAIENSKIAITILSQNYASSHWCLRELAHIMRCKKTMGLKVIPVFYRVDPSDVRNFRNSFRELLAIHALSYDGDIFQSWKQALKEVGGMKGLAVDHKSAEGEIVLSIVQKVKSELNRIYMRNDENLVGFDEHAKEVVAMIPQDTMDMNLVVIHGEPGVGKTTLAKFIYGKLSHRFEYRSFTTNVRETLLQNNGIEFLQEQLIKEAKGGLVKISNYNKGMEKIKKFFFHKKVLILLDDVGDRNQMRTLMRRMCSCLGSQSTILITTRDSDVVNDPGVTWSYELKRMDFHKSSKLFKRHAFIGNNPSTKFDYLSRKVVDISGGLPLSLEVIGSTLLHKEEEEWIRTLENISTKKVDKQMEICYNALDDNSKNIFLDIAWFLTGSDKGIAVHMWKDIGISEEALDTLQRMSLVKITDDNKLHMHDVLRDLGKEIARKKNGGKHNRIKAIEVLWGCKNGQEEATIPKYAKFDARLESYLKDERLISELQDIEFLQVIREIQPWDFMWFFISNIVSLWQKWVCGVYPHNIPISITISNIRWLSWHGIPPVLNVRVFTLSNLIALDLSWSKISSDWNGWDHIKSAKKLKDLNLTGCSHLTRTPDLSANKKLERLILERCQRLVEIHKSIGDLEDLIHLNVKGCSNLQQFPQELAKLKSLQELLIDETAIQQIPELHDMENMKTLSACNCQSLRDCSLLQHLTGLKHLAFKGCTRIMGLPNSIRFLTSLVELDISKTKFGELPESIENLKELRVLRMENSGITKLPKKIGFLVKLEEIHANSCDAFEGEVPDGIAQLQFLRILILSGNFTARISKLPASLVQLKLHSDNMGIVPQDSSLSHLRELDLDFNNISTSDCLSWIQNLSSLESLTLRLPVVERQQYLPSWLQLPRIRDCGSMETLDLTNLKGLTTLVLRARVCQIQGLGGLKKLEHLEVESDILSDLPKLAQLENLKILSIVSCGSLQELPELSKLTNLQQLKISYCQKLVNIQGPFKSLEVLSVSGCESLESISNLKDSKKLQVLVVENCENLQDLVDPDLRQLSHLKSLKIRGCFGDDFWGKWQCIKKANTDQKVDINVQKLSTGPLPFCVKLKSFFISLALLILLQFILLRDSRMVSSASETAGSNAALFRLVIFTLVLVRLPYVIRVFKGLMFLLWVMLVKALMSHGNSLCREAFIGFIHMYFPRFSSILLLELLNYIYTQ